MQAQAIPIILDGHDLIACAQTGTGKTAAYLIPAFQRLIGKGQDKVRMLVLAPTRELALQIEANAQALTYFTDLSSAVIFGGKDSANWDDQKKALVNGCDLIVATPGRLITHMMLGYVDFSGLEILVLDEADKMLDMGFYPDIMSIISQLPPVRQTLMFSATMPPKIRKMASEIMKTPKEVSLAISKPAAGIKQMAYMAYDEQKIPLIEHILREREVESMIIFASSKISVDRITRQLKKLNYPVESLHSDKSQEERQAALRAFENREYRIIIGTDVLSRGIDIDNLSHVLNYDVPHDAEDYVHRVGRTARASSTGEAITFISPDDMGKFALIERLIEQDVVKLPAPEEMGESPVYDPTRRSPGRGFGRGGSGQRSGGGGGDRRGGGGGRSNDGNRREGSGGQRRGGPRRDGRPGQENRPRNQGPANPDAPVAQNPITGGISPVNAEGEAVKKKKRKKRKPRPRPEGGQPPVNS